MINVALPKGRLGEKVYAMFENAGYECPSIKENNRKLIFENEEKGIRYFWVKPSDVSIYVERGAADIGVAGKDILLEYSPDVYELLDLNMGKCRMAVAGKKDFYDDNQKTLKVATKFVNIAREYYASKCRDIDIIKLNGSIELAPILGLSDVPSAGEVFIAHESDKQAKSYAETYLAQNKEKMLEETKAISMPEKKAEKAIVMRICMIISIMV